MVLGMYKVRKRSTMVGSSPSLRETRPLLTLMCPVGLTFPFLIRGMQKMQMMKFPVISGEKAGTGKP